MPVTQEDIASELGVSRVLVGYALNSNSRGRISAETRRRIQETAQRLGYRPNHAARALVTGRTYQITLCLPSLGNSFFSEIVRQFEILTHDTAYDLLVTTIARFRRRPSSLTGDGTIFYGTESLPAEFHSRPNVSIIHHVGGIIPTENSDVVLLELKQASHDAMQHLFDQDFKRITQVIYEGMLNPIEPRYAAYTSMMEERGLKPDVLVLPVRHDGPVREEAHRCLVDYFKGNGFPDALFCSNDDIAIGAYRALRELKRDLPGDTAIVGCDDIREGRDLTPALSTIHLPLEEACRSALELLLGRIEAANGEPQPARTISCQSRLIIRESSLVKP